MSVAEAVQTTAKSPSSSSSGFVLQRKCACGGSSSFSGECEECKRKKLLGKPLQRKLAINEPGDEYEREADRVAEQVMRMPEPERGPGVAESPVAPLVQRRVNGGGPTGIGTAPQIVHDVLNSPGQPLDSSARGFFEPRFGHDFSHVRIHADAKAAESARSVNAQAYTIGNHVVFGSHATPISIGSSLLAHELTHVVQQTSAIGGSLEGQVFGHGSPQGCLQRQPLESADSSVEVRAPGNGPFGSYGFAQLRRDHPEFATQIENFSQRFWDLYELTQGPLILSGILDAPNYIAARKQFNDYLDRIRSRERHMTQNDQYWPRDIRSWLEEASVVLGAIRSLIDLAEPGVSDDDQETEAIHQIRTQLPRMKAELTKLQNAPIIRAETERIEAAKAEKRATAEANAARAETPEGRREDALAFTRSFVTNEHNWWSGQAPSTAEVFAERVGNYYLTEKNLTGVDIQEVLKKLSDEDPELLDRALYQGELLDYLYDQGVTGLTFSELPHATGSGFYNGFEFTWRDLIEAQPIAIPSFSPPTPLVVMKYQMGMQWGVLVGIKDGVVSTAQDVLSVFQAETYTQLYAMLTDQIWDESWREEMGKALAIALHAYLQDVGDDGPFEIGKKFGQLIGQAVFEIILGIVTAGVVKVVTKALRGTKWGAALLDFAEDVAHGMPWREPKVIEDDVLPQVLPSDPSKPASRSTARSGVSGGAQELQGQGLELREQIPDDVSISGMQKPSQLSQEGIAGADHLPEYPEILDDPRGLGRGVAQKDLLESAGSREGRPSPNELKAEFQYVVDNHSEVRPSSKQGFYDEMALPNGHTFRRGPCGWVRYSTGTVVQPTPLYTLIADERERFVKDLDLIVKGSGTPSKSDLLIPGNKLHLKMHQSLSEFIQSDPPGLNLKQNVAKAQLGFLVGSKTDPDFAELVPFVEPITYQSGKTALTTGTGESLTRAVNASDLEKFGEVFMGGEGTIGGTRFEHSEQALYEWLRANPETFASALRDRFKGKIDDPIVRLAILDIQSYRYVCENCMKGGLITTAPFPANMKAPPNWLPEDIKRYDFASRLSEALAEKELIAPASLLPMQVRASAEQVHLPGRKLDDFDQWLSHPSAMADSADPTRLIFDERFVASDIDWIALRSAGPGSTANEYLSRLTRKQYEGLAPATPAGNLKNREALWSMVQEHVRASNPAALSPELREALKFPLEEASWSQDEVNVRVFDKLLGEHKERINQLIGTAGGSNPGAGSVKPIVLAWGEPCTLPTGNT